jgi:hypothetical protein
MRCGPVSLISCDFPPLEFYFGMSLPLHRFASGPNGLPAFQYSTVLLQALAEHGLTKTPSGSTKRICTICRLHLM